MNSEMTNGTGQASGASHASEPRPKWPLAVLLIATAVGTFGVAALLVNMFGRKVEARTPFVRVIEVDELTTDPEPWGANWPRQYESYLRTADTARFYGGSSAMPAQKLEEHPWLKRLFSGYAFALDYREARGHAYMLSDQLATKRVTERAQPGACLHCHASVIPTYRRVGLEADNKPATEEVLRGDFDWDAVQAGFEKVSAMSYPEAHGELSKTPDGTGAANAHPVSCVDCHDPDSMQPRVTRPGFRNGIAALAAGDGAVPHLPSIEEWRAGSRARPYDPNRDATRQEMRTFVCAQCHVEYYCGPKETLFFPWDKGLKAENIEAVFDEHTFPDGSPFADYKHGETGAPLYKAQHPEFELWSQGIHARSGVSCADCHMPFERVGALKVSSHWVRSPMESVNRSCQTSHNVPEQELVARVDAIQERTYALRERAAVAMTDMLDEILAAQASGAAADEMKPILDLQRKSQWRLDYISSENSLGFHADQEAARLLAESIDYSRQAQTAAIRLRAERVERDAGEPAPILGVTPTAEAPIQPH